MPASDLIPARLLAKLRPYQPMAMPTSIDDTWGDPSREIGRYALIAGYCSLITNPTILDIGCGVGLLERQLRHFARLVGIDTSAEAIRSATRMAAPLRARYHAIDIEHGAMPPGGPYDIVVFNEVLYYLDNPRQVLLRAPGWLASPCARIVISMYDSSRSRKLWLLVDELFATEHASHLRQEPGGTAFQVRLLRPRR